MVIALSIGDDHHAFLHRAHPQDAALRLVDDGCGEQRAADAVIGEGEGAALDFIRAAVFSSARGRPGR